MYDEWGPPPIDSYDLYARGLRPPRCNGCKYAELKWQLGDKFLELRENRWVNIYELDAAPAQGQAAPLEHNGHSIRFRAGFLSIGHSNECYHWQPPGDSKRESTKRNENNKPKPSFLRRFEGFCQRLKDKVVNHD